MNCTNCGQPIGVFDRVRRQSKCLNCRREAIAIEKQSQLRKNLLDSMRLRGTLTRYSTATFVHALEAKIAANGGKTEGVSFAGENLTGLDLSHNAICPLVEEYKSRHAGQEPTWYSGSMKRESVVSRPEVIASAPGFNTQYVIAKEGINLEGVDFCDAILVGVDFTQADLVKTKFKRARLQYSVLHWTRLWECDFEDARMQGADLRRAAMQNANLTGVYLRGSVLSRCLLYHVKLNRTEFTKDEILGSTLEELQHHYRDAAIAYNRLKNNFVSVGNYKDAAWAYIHEQRMLGHQWPWWHPRGLWNRILDWIFAYGERPWQMALAAGSIVAIFGLIYRFWGSLQPASSGSVNWYDPWIFSLKSFVTMEDMVSGNIVARIGGGVEAMLGVIFLALFVYSLSRRLSGY